MARNFGTNLNFNKNEAQNMLVHKLGTAPSSPVAGQIYYNTADGNVYIYDGLASAWVDLTQQAVTPSDATTSAKGIVQLAGDLGGTGTTAAAPVISAGAIDATKVSATLKPSGSAAAGTEALRALGATGSTALAGNTRLDQIAVPTASVSLNSQKITNLLDPTAPQDAATKIYVDNTAQGLDAKASVRVATTAAGTLATSFANGQTVDGVTLATGDRILIKDQAAAAENGIYVVAASGAPTRATDADTWTELVSAFTWVEVGTTNADTGWLSTVDAGGTLGTTAVTITQFSGAGQITAGAGLTKTGNTLDVIGTTNRISVAADSIDISTSYVGQASITTLGTIGTGTWQGTAVGTAYGGTGATTIAAARTNLSTTSNPLPQKYSTTVGDAAASSFAVTHNLNTTNVAVEVFKVSTGDTWTIDVTRTSANVVTVAFGFVPAANEFGVVIVG